LEHVVTSSHTFSHFFRQVKGRPQVTQILEGKFSFFIPLGMPTGVEELGFFLARSERPLARNKLVVVVE
jgi:hypothetical protein